MASPLQKTMVAQMPPPQLLAQASAPPQQQGPSPNKTMLINPSEGVVSMAQAQGMHVSGPTATAAEPAASQGASAGYWAVCLLMGVAIGVGAYLLVRFL